MIPSINVVRTTRRGLAVDPIELRAIQDYNSYESNVITAGGSINTSKKAANIKMIKALYTKGLRDINDVNHVIRYCLPFGINTGSSIDSIFYPLYAPNGVSGILSALSNSSYTLGGYSFGGANYFDTGFIISDFLSNSSCHISLDVKNTNIGSQECSGCGTGNDSWFDVLWQNDLIGANLCDTKNIYYFPSDFGTTPQAELNGLFIANRLSNTRARITVKGVNRYDKDSLSDAGSSSQVPNISFCLGAYKDESSVGININETIDYFTLGHKMTPQQELDLNSIVATYRSEIAAS